MASTQLTLIRHGQTEWNVERRFQGQQDSPLTARGLKQAEDAAQSLVDAGVDVLISSDLPRAQKTATLIGSAIGLEPTSLPIWRERAFGSIEGEPIDQIDERFGTGTRKTITTDEDFKEHGVESLRSLSRRIEQGLNDVLENHSGKHVLVVTHGAFLHVTFKLIVGIPLTHPRRFSLPNAGINRLVHDGEHWLIDQWGIRA